MISTVLWYGGDIKLDHSGNSYSCCGQTQTRPEGMSQSGEFYGKVRCVDMGGIRKIELLGSTVRMMNCNVGLIKE